MLRTHIEQLEEPGRIVWQEISDDEEEEGSSKERETNGKRRRKE